MPKKSKRNKKDQQRWEGARRKGKGYEGNVRIHPGPGGLKTKMFYGVEPAVLVAIQGWRSEQAAAAKKHIPVSAGSFYADLLADLPQVAGLASYAGIKAHYELWAHALGRNRTTESIETADVSAVLQRWLATPVPSRGKQPGLRLAEKPISPGTILRRRASLYGFFKRRGGHNPVINAYAPPRPKPEARGTDYRVVYRIINAMHESHAKRRAEVMALTGLPPKMIGLLDPADLDLDARTLRVPPRRKGRGVEARTLELLPQAVEAFRRFDAANCWGKFRASGVWRAFRRACRRLRVNGVRLYDLRHSFAAFMYEQAGDLPTVTRFMLHSNTTMTERYAKSALRHVDRAVADRAGAALDALLRGNDAFPSFSRTGQITTQSPSRPFTTEERAAIVRHLGAALARARAQKLERKVGSASKSIQFN